MDMANETQVPPVPPKKPADKSAVAPDGVAAPKADPQFEFSAKLAGASNAALAQHAAEQSSPKRGRGRPATHGRYAKKLPVGFVANGPVPIYMADETQAPVFEAGGEAAAPFADEEAIKAVVSGLIEGLNDLAANFQRTAVMRFLNDEKLADEAAKSARMSEKVQGMVQTGALLCIKKYSVDVTYAPEAALFGGLAIWLGGNFLTLQRVKSEAKKLGFAQVSTPNANEKK